MQRDSLANTLVVTAVLGITCSLLVSGAAVGLRDLQQKNKAAAFQKAILDAADLDVAADSDSTTVFEANIEPRIVDLATGTYLEESSLDPATYDQRRAARDPDLSVKIPPEDNLAGIGRREKYAVVYLVLDGSKKVKKIVFPIYGKGLFSTLYGFITLDSDLNTVRGINYYQHGETPGLGAGIEEEKWQDTWKGKEVYGENGQPVIKLVKSGAEGPHQVDGLSGATLTSNGVTNMVQYWLGEHGFAPFINNLRDNNHTNGG